MLCKQQSWGRQSLFNHSNKDKCVSVFCRLSQNTILKWAISKLLLLFKIYTSYIMSKCKSVKMINIPWFLVPHFYLLSVQSYKRLKLRAFKEWLFRKTNGRQMHVVRINTFANVLMLIFRELKDILVYLEKKIVFMNSREMIISFRIFLRSRHEKRCSLWN